MSRTLFFAKLWPFENFIKCSGAIFEVRFCRIQQNRDFSAVRKAFSDLKTATESILEGYNVEIREISDCEIFGALL